jgi:hypothetical protein
MRYIASMHSPLRHAANEILRRNGHADNLDTFIRSRVDNGVESAVVMASAISRATDDLIVVDRRTVQRWMDKAAS